MSRIDASGRLTSQAISQVLDWRPGDRVTLTAGAGVVVVRRDPHGMVTVPARCSIAIPAGLRHRCGLRPGDQVLLAALPHQDTLAACTFAVVDQALGAHPLFPRREGGLS
jgi:bifunctional DNA-binding transcriptional regulator/antitoxin component of YhaV-PrlF toxin-antitoxin module